MHRCSVSGRPAFVVGAIVSAAMAPVLACLVLAACASTAGAADADAPAPMKKIERKAVEKADVVEKASDKKENSEKDPGVKKAGEKVVIPAAGEKSGKAGGLVGKKKDTKGSSGKAGDEKVKSEKSGVEKNAGDKAAVEKNIFDKPVEDKGFGEEPVNPRDKESVLVWLYHSMGMRYVVIFLGVTFNEIALVVMIDRRSSFEHLNLQTLLLGDESCNEFVHFSSSCGLLSVRNMSRSSPGPKKATQNSMITHHNTVAASTAVQNHNRTSFIGITLPPPWKIPRQPRFFAEERFL